MLPDFLGGKTYFYLNYEGERYPRSGPFQTVVPSDLLRQGIFQIKDATGNLVKYNLANMADLRPQRQPAVRPARRWDEPGHQPALE